MLDLLDRALHSDFINRGLFITGTGTNIGKSVVTGLLAARCFHEGLSPITQKWVQTGAIRDNDIAVHENIISAQGFQPNRHAHQCVYSLDFPGSPHLAAHLADTSISPDVIKTRFKSLSHAYTPVLVEGSGGLLTPLSHDYLQIDLVLHLRLACIVVIGNELGCINHTLMTLDILRDVQIPILGLIICDTHAPKNEDEALIMRDNPEFICQFTRIPILAHVPFFHSLSAATLTPFQLSQFTS